MCNYSEVFSDKLIEMLSLHFCDDAATEDTGKLSLDNLAALEAVGQFIGQLESSAEKDFAEELREHAIPAMFSDSAYELMRLIREGKIAGPFTDPDQGYGLAAGYQTENGKRWICLDFGSPENAEPAGLPGFFSESCMDIREIEACIEDDFERAGVPEEVTGRVKEALDRHQLEAVLTASVLDMDLVKDIFLYHDRFADLLGQGRLVINADPEDADMVIFTPAGTVCGFGIFGRF